MGAKSCLDERIGDHALIKDLWCDLCFIGRIGTKLVANIDVGVGSGLWRRVQPLELLLQFARNDAIMQSEL